MDTKKSSVNSSSKNLKKSRQASIASSNETSAKKPTEQANKPFAAGVCFRKMFFIFLIGSVIGSVYEEILYMGQSLIKTGQLDFALRQGVIYGPFNVVYGFGAVLMCLVLVTKKRPAWQTFTISAVLGGVLEYILSLLQEIFTHTVSWDYSNKFLNIGGRTTIPYMLVWGLLGLVFVDYVYPFFSRLIERIPLKTGEIFFRVALVFMLIDMAVSWTAVIRQTLRHNNVPPFTPVGEFYDSYYTDEFLEHYYPNMRHHDLETE